MLIDLLSIYVIVWIIKTAVEDTAHAVKGTPNPRYELRKQKALAAGRPVPTQPRYGSRDWLGDLVSDGLAAQTERRRRKAVEKAKAKAKASGTGDSDEAAEEPQPVDDMVDEVGVRTPAAKGVGDTPLRPTFRAPDNAERTGGPRRNADETAAQRPMRRGHGLTNCEHCGTEVLVGHLHRRTIDGREKQVCAHCGGLIKVDASVLAPVPVGETVGGPVFVLTDDGRAQSVPSPADSSNGDQPARYGTCGCGARLPMVTMARIGGVLACPDCAAKFVRTFDDKVAERKGSPNGSQPTSAVAGTDPTSPLNPGISGQAPMFVVDLEQVRQGMKSGLGQCLGCGQLKPLVARYWVVSGEVCADCASKIDPKDLRPIDDAPLAPVIPLFKTPNKEDIMPTVDGEVTGLDPAISYANALALFAGEHGQAGNEGYISFLSQSKVTGAGLQTATDMQEAFANAQSAAERHAAELAKQKTVQEAYDQNPDAGDKAFQQGGR